MPANTITDPSRLLTTRIVPLSKHPNFTDLTDRNFGRLVVIGYLGRNDKGKPTWLCRCECGNEKVTQTGYLLSGDTTSCGCLFSEQLSARNYRHGKSSGPTYNAWLDMNKRCYGEYRIDYVNYGGRGITVCDAWRDSYETFLADMGERPGKGYSLDRKDVNGNYEPGNCRWATKKQQARNCRNSVYLTYKGRTQCIADWADEIGIRPPVLSQRLRYGWSVEEAIETPLNPTTYTKRHAK